MFFHYGEDENYCQRVRYHGLKIGVVPAATIRHDRENRIRPDKTRRFDENALERELKRYLGDVNITPDFNAKERVWRNEILKSVLQLNFKNFRHNIHRYRVLLRVIPEIFESRERNKVITRKY